MPPDPQQLWTVFNCYNILKIESNTLKKKSTRQRNNNKENKLRGEQKGRKGLNHFNRLNNLPKLIPSKTVGFR